MQNDLVNKTLLNGLIDFHHKDLFLYIPKYQIKAIDSRMCLCHCVSGKNFEKKGRENKLRRIGLIKI